MPIEKSMKDVIADTLNDGYLNIGRPAKVGDLVRIVKGFRYVPDEHCGQLAVVSKISTSFDGRKELVLTHKGNKTAWWNQDQLNFIKADQLHLVDEWKIAEIRKKKRMKSFDFLVEWVKKYPGVYPPKECISFIWEQINPGKSMWGSHGEGMRALINSMTVIQVWITVVRSFNKPVTDQNKAQFRKHLVSVVNTFRKANKASSNV